ncbi:LexA family transcriptional regulator [Levilactobacillus brevis]|uniref:LexA family transcriptional regulator n=1 Tax=Levilactobacillus brevis TaxID=1580 RepID=A0AA41ERL3_LEVBR|nr:XRE family transcriptional regulator [Levilactobacillus brevis]MBS0948405.1 LexA family transcriptional regulator [Levilactobacillus brevis]MBS1011598.1 LexA family transcriptional regulator [Levilactobacillus brevis]
MAKVVLPQMIDYYRKQNNMTMAELGSKLGKTTSAISRWVSGSRSPMVDDLERLSNLFNVDIKTLMYGADDDYANMILKVVSKLSVDQQKDVYSFAKEKLASSNSSNVIKFPKDDDTLKITASGVLSAGVGEFLDDSTKPFTVTVHKPVPSNYDYAFQINGHSMEPVYQDKQVVFVKKEDDYRDGQIIAAVMDGCAYLKKLSVVDGEATLVSLNPQYPNIKVDKENGVKVLGVVFS